MYILCKAGSVSVSLNSFNIFQKFTRKIKVNALYCDKSIFLFYIWVYVRIQVRVIGFVAI